MASSETITATSLHEPTHDLSHLTTPTGQKLSAEQSKNVAIVLDFFQAKGTMAKMNDNFVPDAIYEDLFATCKNREEVAGQLVNLPLVVKSTETHTLNLLSITPTSITTDAGHTYSTDEIKLAFKHTFEFRTPLPKSASQVTMDTNLFVYSAPEGIVKVMDRGDDQIPDNSILSMMRKMNAVVAPRLTGLPANDKEDAERVLKTQ